MQYQLQVTADLDNHEQLFITRYQHLFGWALHLTGRDRAEAEDLLHDAFIQFTLTSPDLNAIRNLDGYLFGVLRVLWLSRQRRAGRMRLQQHSAIEYDSAEMGLWLSDPRELNRVQDELRAICRYACERKESSKAGSVLILRFFHGYYPGEIASVLQATRKAVDSRLALARQEAKVFLNTPERLSFMKPGFRTVKPHVEGSREKMMIQRAAKTSNSNAEENLIGELRAEIFSSRQGDCLTREGLRRLYASGEAASVESDRLAHLVSCPRCLDCVNEILGLPPLAERHPNDTLGYDPGDSDGGTSGGTNAGGNMAGNPTKKDSGELQRRACRRAREVFEHQPQELHVAVNGRLVASQKVNAELNEQTVELRPEDLAESTTFIEVFSEMGLRMLLLYVDNAITAPKLQTVNAELSDGRSLEMDLQLQAGASLLTVVYQNPLAQSVETEPQPSLWERAANWLREATAVTFAPRPALLAALMVVMCVAGLFAYLSWPVPRPVTAAELLQKSIAAESAFATEKGKVTHRTFNIETRNRANGEIVARSRVELWQSADNGLSVRRLFDERNRLVAGEWLRADGSSELLFREERKPKTNSLHQVVEFDPAIWRLALDAQKFSSLVGTTAAVVNETDNAYVLSHQWANSGRITEQGELLAVTLTLDRSSMRLVAQTLVVRTAEGIREHRLSEAKFEQLPASSASPEIFQTDSELLGADVRRVETLAVPAAITGNASAQPNAINAGALEIEARYLLDQANANFGEQVSLTRTVGGLKIHALVETPQRKSELLAALSSLRVRQGVTMEVETYEEAARRQRLNDSVPSVLSDAVIAQRPILVAAELRRYFASSDQAENKSENWIGEQVARFTGRILAMAPRSLRHVWALNSLVTQLSPEELAALPAETKAKWRQMVRAHALAIKKETESLRAELQPIFYPAASTAALPQENDPDDLKQLAARLSALASEHDTVIGKAFSRSANAAAGEELKSLRFWQSLRRAELLAEAVLKTRELVPEN